jgi:endonuclease YncB( thermonuclease family)
MSPDTLDVLSLRESVVGGEPLRIARRMVSPSPPRSRLTTTNLFTVLTATAALLLSIDSAAAASPCPIVPGGEVAGKVVAISDGDTFTLLTSSKLQVKVRLIAIDAPERSQAFGRKSTANLASLIFQRGISARVTKVDRYSRCVARVTINGLDVSLEQLRAGLAWVYDDYIHELSALDRSDYLRAQAHAKAKRIGLWSDPSPVAPWAYRRSGSQQTTGRAPQGRQQRLTDEGLVSRGAVIGNKRSGIYHLRRCPGWRAVAEGNIVPFSNEAEAVAAGYRKAKNCP